MNAQAPFAKSNDLMCIYHSPHFADERYAGVYVIGKRAVLEVGGTRSRLKDRESWYIIPDHHPAIVERAVFDTVQASQLRLSQPNKKEAGLPTERQSPLWLLRSCAAAHHAENLVLLLPPFRGGRRKPLPQDAPERRRAGTVGIPAAIHIARALRK